MLCSACVVPSAPLLLPDLVPDDAEVAALRRTCVDAVRAMVAADPERIVVIGGPTAAIPVARFGDVSEDPYQRSLGNALVAWLLASAGWSGPQPDFVDADKSHSAFAHGDLIDIGATGHPVAVMVLADLCAAVSDSSPRPRDDVAVTLSNAIAEAVASADIDSLLAVDPERARRMQIEGAAALRGVASVAKGTNYHATTLFRGAPFGVEYVISVWQRRAPSGDGAR